MNIETILFLSLITLALAARPIDKTYTTFFPSETRGSYEIKNAIAFEIVDVVGNSLLSYFIQNSDGAHAKFSVYLFNQTSMDMYKRGSDFYECLNGKECTFNDDWPVSYEWFAFVPSYERFYVVVRNRNVLKNARLDAIVRSTIYNPSTDGVREE